MTSHELAKLLLEKPDMSVASSFDGEDFEVNTLIVRVFEDSGTTEEVPELTDKECIFLLR